MKSIFIGESVKVKLSISGEKYISKVLLDLTKEGYKPKVKRTGEGTAIVTVISYPAIMSRLDEIFNNLYAKQL